MRSLTMDDMEAVKKLINMCEIALDGNAETTLEDMQTEWTLPSFDLATDAWLVLAPEGQIVAFADLGHTDHMRIYTGAYVHPDYRRRGIGTCLLGMQEARARQHIPQAPEDVRVVLSAGVSSLNHAGQRLLEKHGYTLVRHFWRMEINMSEAPPTPAWPAGMTLRTFAAGMERAIFEADEDAFKDHWGFLPMRFEEWEHWSLKRHGFDPSLWFLAMEGDEIGGFALCQDEQENGGWVHVLGVRRPWRRKGLGLALLHHAFGEFYRRGIRNVYLGVDAQSLTGATRLYERAGMHVFRQYGRYEKELRAGKELSTQSLEV